MAGERQIEIQTVGIATVSSLKNRTQNSGLHACPKPFDSGVIKDGTARQVIKTLACVCFRSKIVRTIVFFDFHAAIISVLVYSSFGHRGLFNTILVST